jgi:DNA-binding MarR family transcriptional regulator
MTDECDASDQVVLPALLRAARDVYGAAIRAALIEAGYDDVPRNGIYVIGAIARFDLPLGRIIRELRVSKQAAGQLVDMLVLRGYLSRAVDEADRRKLTVALTERGRAAAAVSRTVVDGIEAELVRRVGAEHVARTRATLAALIDMQPDAVAEEP